MKTYHSITVSLSICIGIVTASSGIAMQNKKTLHPAQLIFGTKANKFIEKFGNENTTVFCKTITEMTTSISKFPVLFDGNPGTNQCHFISLEVATIARKIRSDFVLTDKEKKFLALCLLTPNGFSKTEESRKQFADRLMDKHLLGKNSPFKQMFQYIFAHKCTSDMAENTLADLIFKTTSDFIKEIFKPTKNTTSEDEKVANELLTLIKKPKSLMIGGKTCLPKFPGIFAFFKQLETNPNIPIIIRTSTTTGDINLYSLDHKTGNIQQCKTEEEEFFGKPCVIINGKGKPEDIAGHALTDLMKGSAASFMKKKQNEFVDLLKEQQPKKFLPQYPTLLTQYIKAFEFSKETSFEIDHVSPGLLEVTMDKKIEQEEKL